VKAFSLIVLAIVLAARPAQAGDVEARFDALAGYAIDRDGAGFALRSELFTRHYSIGLEVLRQVGMSTPAAALIPERTGADLLLVTAGRSFSVFGQSFEAAVVAGGAFTRETACDARLCRSGYVGALPVGGALRYVVPFDGVGVGVEARGQYLFFALSPWLADAFVFLRVTTQ
jgi:hypothetical protein